MALFSTGRWSFLQRGDKVSRLIIHGCFCFFFSKISNEMREEKYWYSDVLIVIGIIAKSRLTDNYTPN